MAEQTRADAGGPFKEFVFEEWLREGLDGLRSKLEQKKARLNKAEFRKHLRNAQKEQLLAIRSLIDSAIECLEEEETKS